MTAHDAAVTREITRFTPIADLPELLRIEEVCVWLDIRRSKAYEMARTCELPSVRLGRLLRIPRSALAQMVDQKGALIKFKGRIERTTLDDGAPKTSESA